MKFIKRNKSTIAAIVVFLIVIVLLFQIKNIFFPNEGTAIYGDRLKGIEKVKISSSTEEKIATSLEETVSKTELRTSGRLVNIILTVNDDVSRDNAKTYASKCLESFSEEQKKYYDFQVFINKKIESDEFPIIGYKHHSKEEFSWTKDRTGNA